jgi:Pathogenicity locus.
MSKSELEQIPSIGAKMAQHLAKAGYPTIASLKGANPDDVYERYCLTQTNLNPGKCPLYVYRMAVYYANGGRDPKKLKWWNWK